MWKNFLAPRTAYPKCSAMCFKYTFFWFFFFFQVTSLLRRPWETTAWRETWWLYTPNVFSKVTIFCLELLSMWIWILLTETSQNYFKLQYSKYSCLDNRFVLGHVFSPWLFLAKLSPYTELPHSMHRAHFLPVGVPLSTIHDNHIDR